MQKFKFFTASPLKMRASGTGRKFAEYDQRATHENFPRKEKIVKCDWRGRHKFFVGKKF
jgi:hypothetical protein